MNEVEAIEYVSTMLPLEKLSHYMNLFINFLPEKCPITFEFFCSNKNIIKHVADENWQQNGFASKEWISLNAGSIYHSVYHNLTNE